jgi:hypothetical protein
LLATRATDGGALGVFQLCQVGEGLLRPEGKYRRRQSTIVPHPLYGAGVTE